MLLGYCGIYEWLCRGMGEHARYRCTFSEADKFIRAAGYEHILSGQELVTYLPAPGLAVLGTRRESVTDVLVRVTNRRGL